jgi:very-short-patch-repair endonuclease
MQKIDLTKIDWNAIKKEHKNGLFWTQIPKRFGFSRCVLERAERDGFIEKIKHECKHTEKSKKTLSLKMHNYLKNNPEKCVWKRSDKFKSAPCEKLKKHLKDNNISFVEEYKPLKNRLFSIDIAFPDKKIGIEVNGMQHYNKDRSLKEYYQKRKEDIEKEGWKLFDVYYSKIYKDDFVTDLVNGLKKEHDLTEVDYSFYIKEKKIKLNKYGNRKQYSISIINENYIKKHSGRIVLIRESGIDFSKFGWVNKVGLLIGLSYQKVNEFMKKYLPEIYESAFKKKVYKHSHSSNG